MLWTPFKRVSVRRFHMYLQYVLFSDIMFLQGDTVVISNRGISKYPVRQNEFV